MVSGSSAATVSSSGSLPAQKPTIRRSRTALWLIGLALLIVTGLVVALVYPSSHRPPAEKGLVARLSRGMHLVFSDDFSGTRLDSAKWDTCYPWFTTGHGCTNFSNPELEWYLPSQVQVSGGVLHLVASEIPTLGESRDGRPMTYQWRSGMVTSYGKFDFTYGLVEIQAHMVKGDGLWPALWMLPFPQSGIPEIDIAENIGDYPEALQVYLHGTTGSPNRTVAITDLPVGWHTFVLDWQPGSLTWYVDGTQVYRYAGSNVPHQPMYLLADLAVGNFVTAHPTPSTPPRASFNIRRVAVYQR